MSTRPGGAQPPPEASAGERPAAGRAAEAWPATAGPATEGSAAEQPATAGSATEGSAAEQPAAEQPGRPGLTRTALLDDRARPTLRERLGHALARASEADFAVARIRLAAIDLTAQEVGRVRRCRVLVGRLDAEALVRTGAGAPGAAQAADPATLRAFLDSGRLEVRAAGLEVWTPDFSVLRGLPDTPDGTLVVVGAHYFARPFTNGGPAFTCMLTERSAAQRAGRRFEELWRQGYDVADILREALARLDH